MMTTAVATCEPSAEPMMRVTVFTLAVTPASRGPDPSTARSSTTLTPSPMPTPTEISATVSTGTVVGNTISAKSPGRPLPPVPPHLDLKQLLAAETVGCEVSMPVLTYPRSSASPSDSPLRSQLGLDEPSALAATSRMSWRRPEYLP